MVLNVVNVALILQNESVSGSVAKHHMAEVRGKSINVKQNVDLSVGRFSRLCFDTRESPSILNKT